MNLLNDETMTREEIIEMLEKDIIELKTETANLSSHLEALNQAKDNDSLTSAAISAMTFLISDTAHIREVFDSEDFLNQGQMLIYVADIYQKFQDMAGNTSCNAIAMAAFYSLMQHFTYCDAFEKTYPAGSILRLLEKFREHFIYLADILRDFSSQDPLFQGMLLPEENADPEFIVKEVEIAMLDTFRALNEEYGIHMEYDREKYKDLIASLPDGYGRSRESMMEIPAAMSHLAACMIMDLEEGDL